MSLYVLLLCELCFRPLGGLCTQGWGRMPGSQTHMQAVICTSAPCLGVLISSLSPEGRSACKASRELFTALGKERGGRLCSHTGTALPRWLALLPACKRLFGQPCPQSSFEVLKAFAERPVICPKGCLVSSGNSCSKADGRRCP